MRKERSEVRVKRRENEQGVSIYRKCHQEMLDMQLIVFQNCMKVWHLSSFFFFFQKWI